ncbi:hypothetical protein V1511DRAFT_367460 [Dipodascopsis uninucleata]
MPKLSSQLGTMKDRYLALPFVTLTTVITIVAVFVISLFAPDITKMLVLLPEASLGAGVYRMFTYPIPHLGFLHLAFNVFALVPVLAAFEEEVGSVATIGSLLVFTVLPGIAYSVLMTIFGSSTGLAGSSGWVFSLMSYFALKDAAFRTSIYLTSAVHFPTWAAPILTLFAVAILLPSSSFIGHALGLAVGYAYGLGYLNMLKLPQHLVLKIESKLSSLHLLQSLPRFVSDDIASKHSLVFDPNVEPGVPSGGSSPVLSHNNASVGPSRSSSFIGQGRTLA